MAKIIDKEPKYEGEKIVWNAFSAKLPQHWVVYNTRSVNGREYDFCVMAPNLGLFIIEVKGWEPSGILTVVDQNTIFITGREEAEDSPRGQARGYRFNMLKKIQKELGMNPLVMSFVCYPLISEQQYSEKGLNIVSEINETIFKEDLLDSAKLFQKFTGRYNIDKGAKHDELDSKRFALLRHNFEPNYDLKMDVEDLNPGYSRLRTFKNKISDIEVCEIVEEYFKGIKEIVFVDSKETLLKISSMIDKYFVERKIHPEKNNLSVGIKPIELETLKDSFSIFNLQVELISNLEEYIDEDLLIEEGLCSDEEKKIIKQLSEISAFNFQQFEIEHSPSDKNILIAAGAGTGKTYSMVSRVAYLCNRTADAVVNISGEIAMITFTNDAAENMKRRVKQMFINYFVLTSNEKFMRLIEDMSQVQISSIHKFAISLLQKDCMRMGLGYDSQISNETYNRKQLYHQYLNEYLEIKSEEDPDFVRQLTMPTYKLEELLIEFCDKLYDRSIDIKRLELKDFGNPMASIPYFNELIMDVVIKAEKDYADDLKEMNMFGLRECMIQIHDLVSNGKLMKHNHRYKYVFVDEFQDTDDIQIDTLTELQKLFGTQCRLFIVGDLKQSIYRFRGASLSAFKQVKRIKGIGQWVDYSLNRNYRTDRRLLDIFHQVFLEMGNNGILPYIQEDDRLKSQLVKEYIDEDLIKKVDVHSKDKESFYDDLFKQVKNQITKLEKLCESKNLSAEEKTIAILVRYNYQIANIVKEAEKNDIVDYIIRVTEGGDLYRLNSTFDLYKLVLSITHPHNKVYLTNIIKSNFVTLDVNIAELSGYSKKKKTEELIRLLNEYFMLHMGKNWNQLVSDFDVRPVLVVLRDVYEACKPWIHYKDEESQKQYRENFDCLIEKITYKYSREYLTINKVCDFLKINITTYQEEPSRNTKNETDEIRVICTTIHKSKGMEYGTVILPFTNEDCSNIEVGGLNVNVIKGKVSYSISSKGQGSDYSGDFDEQKEIKEKTCEEARVLYVAMTRAIRNFVWLNDLDIVEDESWGSYMEVIG
ncbi:hypothetical protein SH2C18_19880 [Clostridium sediminicola]|uniref:UvrD-helicase domain-containing protein n=1 Tax=Clostridium sediminicola TaxID=3114879 RepID=UPI0031F21E3D